MLSVAPLARLAALLLLIGGTTAGAEEAKRLQPLGLRGGLDPDGLPDPADLSGDLPLTPVLTRFVPRPLPTAGRALPAGQRSLSDDPMAELDDAFAAFGYRGWGLILQPTVETTLGASTNAAGRAGGDAGTFVKVAPSLLVQSDWSRHGLEAAVSAGLTYHHGQSDLDSRTISASLHGRLDLADGWTAGATAKVGVTPGRSGDPTAPVGTSRPSSSLTRALLLDSEKVAGQLTLAGRMEFERTTFSGGQTAGGGPVAGESARDADRLLLATRATYTALAAFQPYVEAQARRQTFLLDDNRARDSGGGALLAGATIDTGAFVTAKAEIGVVHAAYRDPALAPVTGLIGSAGITYLPTRLTRIRLDFGLDRQPTTLAGASMAVEGKAAITVDHAIRRDLTASAGLSWTTTGFPGTSQRNSTFGAGSELAWRMDPHWQFFTRGDWTMVNSSDPAARYRDLTILAGLRAR